MEGWITKEAFQQTGKMDVLNELGQTLKIDCGKYASGEDNVNEGMLEVNVPHFTKDQISKELNDKFSHQPDDEQSDLHFSSVGGPYKPTFKVSFPKPTEHPVDRTERLGVLYESAEYLLEKMRGLMRAIDPHERAVSLNFDQLNDFRDGKKICISKSNHSLGRFSMIIDCADYASNTTRTGTITFEGRVSRATINNILMTFRNYVGSPNISFFPQRKSIEIRFPSNENIDERKERLRDLYVGIFSIINAHHLLPNHDQRGYP